MFHCAEQYEWDKERALWTRTVDFCKRLRLRRFVGADPSPLRSDAASLRIPFEEQRRKKRHVLRALRGTAARGGVKGDLAGHGGIATLVGGECQGPFRMGCMGCMGYMVTKLQREGWGC